MQEMCEFKVRRCIRSLLARCSIFSVMNFIGWLVVYPITFCFYNVFTALRHACNNLLALFFGNFIPCFVDTLPMLNHATGRGMIVPVEPSFEQSPHILNWVEVRRLCRSLHNGKLLICQPFLYDFLRVLRIVIVLKDHSLRIDTIIRHCCIQIVYQNDKIQVFVENIINFDDVARSFPRDAAPKFDVATAMLHCLLYMTWKKVFMTPFPRVQPSVRAKTIDFCLVRPNDKFPVI